MLAAELQFTRAQTLFSCGGRVEQPHFVVTLGFHADHAIRRLAILRPATVTVVTASPLVKAVEKAYKDIVAFTDRTSLPHPELVELPVGDPGRAVEILVERLWDRNPIVADLSGGMRPVVVLALTALLLLAVKGNRVEVHVTGESGEAPEAVLDMETLVAIVKGSMSPTRRRIVELLATRGQATPSEIASELKLTERTVRQHLAWLRNHGFTVEKRDVYRPTPWLNIYAKLWRIQAQRA
jgi:CRISPR locus-related DNA-binding protein